MLLTLLHKTGWAQGPLKHDCLSWTVKNSLIVKTPENKEIRPLRQKLRMPLCWNSVLDLDLQHCVQKSGLPCSLTYHKGGHIYFVFYSCHVHRWVGHLSKPDSPSKHLNDPWGTCTDNQKDRERLIWRHICWYCQRGEVHTGSLDLSGIQTGNVGLETLIKKIHLCGINRCICTWHSILGKLKVITPTPILNSTIQFYLMTHIICVICKKEINNPASKLLFW